MRSQDGTIKAFANVCRHRGSLVCLEAHGSTRKFTCPYHGWVYGRSGELVSTSFDKFFPEGTDFSEWGLIRVPREGVPHALTHAIEAFTAARRGGDHSLGFPNVRGIAPHIDGNVGIIHIDRHIDIQEKDMDERMHTTPWFWTTHEGTVTTHRDHSHMHDVGLPNCHPKNLVQVGIGGWYGNRPGTAVAKRGLGPGIVHSLVAHAGELHRADRLLQGVGRGGRLVHRVTDAPPVQGTPCTL